MSFKVLREQQQQPINFILHSFWNRNKRVICHGKEEFTASMKPARYGKPLINTMKPGMETSIQCGVFSSEMEWSFWEPGVTQSHRKMYKSASPRMFFQET